MGIHAEHAKDAEKSKAKDQNKWWTQITQINTDLKSSYGWLAEEDWIPDQVRNDEQQAVLPRPATHSNSG
jgi:hypothetical protein